MSRQLPLDLPHRAALGRDDFFVAPPNALAVAMVDGWADWPQGKLVLIGPEGAGKTHLAHVWAARSGAPVIDAAALAGADIPTLAEGGAVAVEDADRIAGDRVAETALFHLHNMVLAEGGGLLVTARRAPRDWSLALPDLQSRLLAAQVARLEPPDDQLLAAVLVKLFADRQLAVSPRLIPYLVGRIERSFAAARRIVERLDNEGLARGREIGVNLAGQLLDNPAPEGR